MKGWPWVAGFVALAAIFVCLGVLYAAGTISFLVTSTGHQHHYTHAVVMAVLAVAALVAASFARPSTA
jgi:hypothetical protein